MNHSISLQEAVAMTNLYRSERQNILQPSFQGDRGLPISETFSKQAFEQLLSRSDCAGIRIYYGMDENNKIHAIIVGVNASNEDILPPPSKQATEEVYILERGIRCPDLCPPPSPLTY